MSDALHLSIFEQPGKKGFFSTLLDMLDFGDSDLFRISDFRTSNQEGI